MPRLFKLESAPAPQLPLLAEPEVIFRGGPEALAAGRTTGRMPRAALLAKQARQCFQS